MSIEQINTAAFDYDMMLAFIEGTVIGKADITISEFDSTAALVVKVGSKFEVNGALFKVITADYDPVATYAGISNSTTFYLMYDVSAGTFVYTETVPSWNDALQGWYETGETDRYFFSMFKDSGGTLYQNKWKIGGELELYNVKSTIQGNKFYSGSADYDDLFDILDPFIPNVNDEMLLTGSITSGTLHIVSHAIRISSTVIEIYTVNVTTTNSTILTITNGNGTAINLSIAW